MSATCHADPKRARAVVAIAAIVVVMVSACSRPPAWPPLAVDADLGHDACAGCRMIVSDGRFAAQYHDRADPDGATEFFDDLGCLLAAHGGASCDPQGVFVRSFDDAGWVRGDQGFVVRAAAFTSPMGHGLAAFATRPAAEAQARSRADARLFELATLLRHERSAAGVAAADLFAGSKGDHP
jgi:copper chaperone NosL